MNNQTPLKLLPELPQNSLFAPQNSTSGHKKTIIAITNNKRKRLLLLNFTALPALLKQSGITAIKQGQTLPPGNKTHGKHNAHMQEKMPP